MMGDNGNHIRVREVILHRNQQEWCQGRFPCRTVISAIYIYTISAEVDSRLNEIQFYMIQLLFIYCHKYNCLKYSWSSSKGRNFYHFAIVSLCYKGLFSIHRCCWFRNRTGWKVYFGYIYTNLNNIWSLINELI